MLDETEQETAHCEAQSRLETMCALPFNVEFELEFARAHPHNVAPRRHLAYMKTVNYHRAGSSGDVMQDWINTKWKEVTTKSTDVEDLGPDCPLDALAIQEGGGHYKGKKIQPVEYIEANELPFLEGCIIKRATRHKEKGGVEDLRKIIHEARLIAQLRYGVDI